jgi:hypothetical protein
MNRSFFEQLWAAGSYLTYTREQFEINVLDEIGIVHSSFREVPPDVVRAIWEDLKIERARTPELFVKYFTTGCHLRDEGWRLSNCVAFPAGQVNAIEEVDAPLVFPTIHVESLLSRPTH